MLCSIKQIRLYSYLSVCCVLLSFIFSLFSCSYVFADVPQDLVTVLTPQSQSSNVLCEDNSNIYSSCVGYNYVVVHLDTGTSIRTYSSNVKLWFNHGTDEIRMPASPNVFDYSISIPSGTNFVNISTPSWLTDGSITVTLSVNGICPACPSCPECEDCNAPYSGILHDILYALFVIPATALVIYFFYCIYRMIIRSTGGRQ